MLALLQPALLRALSCVSVTAMSLPLTACASPDATLGEQPSSLATYSDSVPWSRKPPKLEPVDVPLFVAVTFDDNFVSGLGDVSGGMTWATTFFEPLRNPAGSGFSPTFDGLPVRTSFYDNCLYLQDDSTRKSWRVAYEDGHEIANHTLNHPHGGLFSAEAWKREIAPCTAALSNVESGVGVSVDDVRGFRAPYLEYGSHLFAALKGQGLWYDSSIQSCWGNADDGKACAWPYTFDQGSPDSVDLTAKFGNPTVPPTAGLWELTPSALFVPPDEVATEYGFEPGLRQRVPTDMPAPSFYEAATGRIAPLDVTLFVDAGLSAAEVLAILKYTLDLRLSGNRAPFVFIGHTHVYASNYGAAAKAPDASERQNALEDFVRYALSKPVVRLRPVADILTWMRHPEPLNGVVTARPATAGTSGSSAGGNGGVPSAGAGGLPGAIAGSAGGGSVRTGAMPNGSSLSAEPSCSCSAVGRADDPTQHSWLSWLLTGSVVLSRRGKRAPNSPTLRCDPAPATRPPCASPM